MTVLELDKRTLMKISYTLLVPNAQQAERHIGTEQHARRTENIRLHGVLQPITTRIRDGKHEVIAGTGRALSAIELQLADVPVYVLGASDGNTAVLTLVENVMSADLTPIQLLEGIEQIRASRRDWLNKDITQQIGKSEALISQNLTVADSPLARAKLADGTLSLNEAAAVARSSPAEQEWRLALKAAGASSHRVCSADWPGVEQKPEENADNSAEKPAVRKPKRIPIPVPKLKATVTVTSDIASIDGLLAILAEATELVRKSLKDYLTLATATRAWADKAKAVA